MRGIKVSSVEILKRKEGISLIITNGKVERYTGKQAKAVLEQLLAESAPTDKINSIKGIPASKGIAKGLVFVGKDGYYASRKIKKGQILVASMTTVDYLPAMKKASAIVTDDGGITSHAAIISRELGIPCIVGTKIATKVLKDGDLVEVNANKGEVKILN